MNIVFGVIVGLLILMLLVVAHEFGHFIMARRNGVKVNEFGIGFPPRAIAWVKKEVEINGEKVVKWVRIPKEDWQKKQDSLIFSINWLPIGGFCAMDGESAADKRKGTFGAASFWAKTKILFGGVAMNWIVAFLILTVLAWTGMPQFIEHQFYLGDDATEVLVDKGILVAKVLEGSPAAQAGFEVNDEIIEVGDSQKVFSTQEVIDFGTSHAGEEVKYKIKRNDEEKELIVQLNDADAEYSLGVSMQQFAQKFIKSTWSAPIVGAGLTVQLTGETFRGLGELLYNLVAGVVRQFSLNDVVREQGRDELSTVGDSVSGPVGIIGVIFPTFVEAGLPNLMFLAAIISISLACMNILPIPALDGGKWLLYAIYKIRNKELTKETEEKIVYRAFMVLIVLIVTITILDVTKVAQDVVMFLKRK